MYAPGTALVLALIAAALVALGLGPRDPARPPRPPRGSGSRWGSPSVGLVVGLVAALAAGLTTASVLDEPHGWFDQPSLASSGSAPRRCSARWGRRRCGRGGAAAPGARGRGRAGRLRGGAVVWVALALLLALAEIGLGYVAIVASLGAGAALVAAVWTPVRLRWAPLLAGWAIGALVTIQFGVSVTRLFVPLVGRMASPSPDDPFIAVVVALPVLACARGGAGGPPRRPPGLTAALLGALTVVGVALSALAFPYSEAEPKRILIDHVDTGG